MQQQYSNREFYSELPAFEDFSKIAEPDCYSQLPDNWMLLVSDVVGSTAAIAEGKYKSVNMVGAASIIAVLNACQSAQIPFVFGGDGGLVALPSDVIEAGSQALVNLRSASKEMFGLDLRVAGIPVADLRKAGAETLVSKFKLSEGNDLAMFAGSGPQMADRWLKADETSKGYALNSEGEETQPDLDGLSCRWEPLKSRNGTILTIIAQPTGKRVEEEIVKVTNSIGQILGGPISGFAPAHADTMTFKFPPSGLDLEIAASSGQHKNFNTTFWTYFTALMQYFCERFDIKIGDYDGAIYRDELKTNTDYRKFDGALRMVLDISSGQAEEILAFAENEYKAGKLVYGTWQAKEALMTCLLFNLSASQHVHFIDGANGGYALAAKDMKQRIAAG
ncbi:MAG: DUF3095 domain-containing protein [Rhizobiaceae bacterium]